MKTKSEIAVEKLIAGYNCSQAVFMSVADDLGVDKSTAFKIACGFGGGMGRKQEVCGAISGAILAIGLKYGNTESQDKAAKEETYRRVRELMSRFESEHGSCTCRTLLKGCDLNTPEGQRYYKENNLHTTTCAECVRTAVKALETVL